MAILRQKRPEERLIAAIIKYYRENGDFEIYREVAFLNKRIDIILLNRHTNEICAIEAKVAWWKKVVEQAKLNLLGADKVYISLPTKDSYISPNYRFVLKTYGIGLLAVVSRSNKSVVKETLHPCTSLYKNPLREEELRTSVERGFYLKCIR